PRILVWNKADLIAPFARKLLEKKHPDAVVLAASQRESTRPLLVRIARELQERWDESARTPAPPPSEAGLATDAADADDERVAGRADEGPTLEDLLRLGGRRAKRAAPSARASAHGEKAP